MARRRRRTTKKLEGPLRAVSYRRVSTREQGSTEHGLDAQARAIKEAVERRGWVEVADHSDVSTGKRTNGRHGLQEALERLENGEADVLVVAKLDRLSRSLTDFGDIVRRSLDDGWSLLVLDPDVDTSTATGRLCANVLASVCEWEGDIISERTRQGLAEAKAKGKRLGLAPEIPKRVENQIVKLYRKHGAMSRVASILNEKEVPTARGGTWYPTTVQTVLKRAGVR